ncbi:uncharacterized protein B0H18DRAFT_1037551 [Fomitopsis serialis]|uniref:uncharacterized protein n=1 Tax=Fomitopsis serialis TaxID=139415 RepID=UPI0020078094|nr:uncharacterized protein B0H18DRAFT_1037551 [Neoantrodia serialis]KAH9916711.1 hypothetical protein B0H18DRAFT_1037551 [Neoantrodia serialis]
MGERTGRREGECMRNRAIETTLAVESEVERTRESKTGRGREVESEHVRGRKAESTSTMQARQGRREKGPIGRVGRRVSDARGVCKRGDSDQ